jgi:Ca2+-binding EF-hand superfamily protein
MDCINIKHPEFIALQKETGLSVTDLELEVASWQRMTGEERFPTAEELDETRSKVFIRTPINKLDSVLQDVKVFLQNRINQLGRTHIKNKTLHSNRLKRLQASLDTLDATKSLNAFIQDAYERFYGNDTEKGALENFRASLNAKDKDIRELINTAVYFNEFAHSYNILDELREGLVDDVLAAKARKKKSEDLTSLDKLALAIDAKEALKSAYNKEAIPLMADVLYSEKSDSLDEKSKKTIEPIIDRYTKEIEAIHDDKDLSDEQKDKKSRALYKKIEALKPTLKAGAFSKEDLEDMLREVSKDENVIEYLFSPLISSSNAPLALFAKFVKNKLEDARAATISFKHHLDKEFNNFAKRTGRSKNNPAKFNEGLYDKVTEYFFNPTTEKMESKTSMQYVQELDVTAYTKAKAEMFEAVSELKDPSAKAKMIGEWFTRYHEELNQEEINKRIAEKQQEYKDGVITEDEFNHWVDKSMRSNEAGEVLGYKGELTKPKIEFFTSAKWNAMQQSTVMREYYDFLIKQHLDLQKHLPENFKIGYRLWSIRKDGKDKLIEGKVKNTVTDWWDNLINFKASDGERYGSLNAAGTAKFVPIHFTQTMDPEDVSLDLYQSSLVATGMIEKYKVRNDVRPEAEMIKSIFKNKKTAVTDAAGNTIMDKAAKTLGIDKILGSNKNSYNEAHLNSFIDNAIFGEENIKWNVNGYSADKVADSLMKASAISTLGLDFIKNVTNWAQGNIQLAVETAAKEFFGAKDYLAGKLYYNKNLPAMLKDIGTTDEKSLATQLVEEYDALQGEFMDKLGHGVSGSRLKNLFGSDALFFGQHAGEHEIQVTMLFAMLNSTKVKTADGKEVSLLESYEKGPDGKLRLKEGVQFSDKQKKEIMNTLHALNKRMHGIYNSFDKVEAQRHTLGKLVMMYRKYVVPGYKKRFKAIGADQELGGITEGMYRTFFRTIASDLKESKGQALINWSKYTDFEKANLLRFYSEQASILALISIVAALKGADDEDKKTWAYNFALYQALRLKSEMLFYTSPTDFLRIMKSPSAATTQIERVYKLANQLLPWNVGEEYKRNAGKFKKGDNKAFAQFQKLLGLSGSNLHPDQAVKNLEMYD